MEKVEFERLYALQDRVLERMRTVKTGFYLTGGTCINRFCCELRYSDDLDFFSDDVELYRDDYRAVVDALNGSGMVIDTRVNARDFVRLLVGLPSGEKGVVQVDFVCERVPRVGKITLSSDGDRLDNRRNMLANKITAVMSRDEPKDVVDLYALAEVTEFSWTQVLADAERKSSYDREELHYRLASFPVQLIETLRFTSPRHITDFRRDFPRLVRDMAQESDNTLYRG
jgi:predicted nucleotidyltransferase component of viral defense system